MNKNVSADKARISDAEELERSKDALDRKVGICFDIFLILLSVILLIDDLTKLAFFDELRVLGPGAFPIFILVALIALCVWNIIEIATGKGGSSKLSKHIDLEKVGKSMRLLVVIAIAMLLIQFVGFLIAMMAFTFFEMTFLSEKKVKMQYIILTTILLPTVVYFLFGALGISLPSPNWMPF